MIILASVPLKTLENELKLLLSQHLLCWLTLPDRMTQNKPSIEAEKVVSKWLLSF